MITGKNYIGEELSATGSVTYKTIDPEANSENEFTFYEATKEEVNQAAEKASEAFEVYKIKSSKEKAEFLEAIASEIEALGEELTNIYSKESALPEGRAKGECARTSSQLRSFSEMLKEGSWVETIISKAEGKPDIRRMLTPLGPIAVFGASNFPFAFSTAGGDTASALAAGCSVIVKSHPLHAGTGEMVSRAILKATKKQECLMEFSLT
jgi:NADP-dependent aldehyde dehydrogenase